MKKESNKIIEEFKQNKETYNKAKDTIKSLIITLLDYEHIKYHDISARVKDLNSLIGKIQRKNEKYITINEITDIIGVRIITYYSDDVDKVASIIENEFEVDKDNTIDKRKAMEPDRFGYLSLHYVVKINENRSKLNEYALLENISFEIQIRSILQHTWAEIEHDLGYKSELAIPTTLRRNFSRLAGLLEIADKEFLEIKESLLRYEKEVHEKVIKENTIENVEINFISLDNFLRVNKVVQELNSQLMAIFGFGNDFTHIDYNYTLRKLKEFKIDTLEILENLLYKHKDLILKVARYNNQTNDSSDSTVMSADISIFYLFYAILITQGSITKLYEHISNLNTSSLNIDLDDYVLKMYKLNS